MEIAVVGAGPAGLMAAAEAAQGSSVTVFERNDRPGKKLNITGKGRCNVTNDRTPAEFLEHVVGDPRFLLGAINSFTPADTVALLESLGVHTKVERGGRVFPVSDRASDVTAALVANARGRGVGFVFENVVAVEREGDGFVVRTSGGERRFDRVVLACGGASYPATGSNGDGYKLARALGHTIVPLRPALVPVYFAEDVSALEGLSLKNVRVTVTDGGKSFERFGEMLFTRRGASGPTVLTLSSLINGGDVRGMIFGIDLKPALDRETLDKRILRDFAGRLNRQFGNSLGDLLPKSLIPYVVERSGIPHDKPVNSVTRAERERLVGLLKGLTFTLEGLAPIAEGIVTAGGVCVKEVDPSTMESKLVKGLFFAGEMLDVDATTGGYNIQIALSTGHAAGLGAAGIKKHKEKRS